MYRIEVIGADALAAKITKDLNTMTAAKPYWLGTAGNMVKDAIQGNIMSQGLIESGALYDSGRVFAQTKNGVSVGFGNMLGYAEPLELGAIAHEISAGAGWWSSASMLTFQLESGDWFFGPRVDHPGNVAYRYIYHGTFEAFTPILLFFFSQIRGVFGGRM